MYDFQLWTYELRILKGYTCPVLLDESINVVVNGFSNTRIWSWLWKVLITYGFIFVKGLVTFDSIVL